MSSEGTGIFENDIARDIFNGLDTVYDDPSLRALECRKGEPLLSLSNWLNTATVHIALVSSAIHGEPVSCIKKYMNEKVELCLCRLQRFYFFNKEGFKDGLFVYAIFGFSDVLTIIENLKRFPYYRIYGKKVGNQIKDQVFDLICEIDDRQRKRESKREGSEGKSRCRGRDP